MVFKCYLILVYFNNEYFDSIILLQWQQCIWLDLIYIKLYFIIGIDDVVGFEGMEKFCEDIGVELENVSLIY